MADAAPSGTVPSAHSTAWVARCIYRRSSQWRPSRPGRAAVRTAAPLLETPRCWAWGRRSRDDTVIHWRGKRRRSGDHYRPNVDLAAWLTRSLQCGCEPGGAGFSTSWPFARAGGHRRTHAGRGTHFCRGYVGGGAGLLAVLGLRFKTTPHLEASARLRSLWSNELYGFQRAEFLSSGEETRQR